MLDHASLQIRGCSHLQNAFSVPFLYVWIPGVVSTPGWDAESRWDWIIGAGFPNNGLGLESPATKECFSQMFPSTLTNHRSLLGCLF